jgi:hypothetical protein
MYTNLYSEALKGRGLTEDLDVNRRKVLELILEK